MADTSKRPHSSVVVDGNDRAPARSMLRAVGFTDEDFAEEVVQSAKIKDYAVSEFVHAVVQSKAFQSK